MDTMGWVGYYEVEDKCTECRYLLLDHRMASCEFGRKEFPKGFSCPKYKTEDEE